MPNFMTRPLSCYAELSAADRVMHEQSEAFYYGEEAAQTIVAAQGWIKQLCVD